MSQAVKVDWKVNTTVARRMVAQWPMTMDRFGRTLTAEMVKDVKEELSKSVSPARPGTPPGVVTGELRAGIKSTKKGALTWWVHDSVDKGIYLELGRVNTRTGVHMTWPFVTPVFMRYRTHKFRILAKRFAWAQGFTQITALTDG